MKSCLPELIIVEGIKKALWLKQNGWFNVVALNGSVYSNAQHALLSRMGVEKLVLLLDDDKPGRTCTDLIASKFAGSTKLLVPKYPANKTQPDELQVFELINMLNQPGSKLYV
jgi:DNA primase